MAELNCYLMTFNCGRTLVDTNFFAAHFFHGLQTNLPPDFIVLCLEEIAPIAQSFLGGSFLTPYFTRLTTTIHVAAAQRFELEDEYVRVLVRNVGMTALMVFARKSVVEKIQWMETAGVGVGVWDMGNKGAVGARLGLQMTDGGEQTVVTFVAAHLAPMEDAWPQRNEDWKKICEALVFGKDEIENPTRSHDGAETEPLLQASSDSTSCLFSPISHIYFSGDLNYRTSDTPPPKVADTDNWPQPVDSVDDIHHYGHFLENDQLTRERRKGNTLHHLAESEIAFPPTYKYSGTAQKNATRAGLKQEVNEDSAWLWATHRFPSWCDRILYLEAAPPTVRSYTALPVQPTSDHRPVVLSFAIPLQPLPKTAQNIEAPFPIKKDWKEARAAARRYELIVGFAAYLSLTWEGEALLAGTFIGLLGGYVALRALIGS
ncbi:putative inositol 5-phosphatase [Neohortaea acidophila]|uniref:Putative inositol 5-phosphatase n=1 Tax=Neohortaea acidophila TaxID=245834 RepID=A0A6A6PZB6_9PEZI|nr:putative inositol 5-phosphatase [Neohortaea acidophila]KAF2485109.1 putative inositol 5-phosphatase [Neohortaea acidophila]